MKKLLLPAVAAVCLVLVARAEVLVYDLSFNNTGTNVNYSSLEGGYLVVDSGSKAVTSIVTQTDPQTRLLYYTTGVLSGTYMELLSEDSNQEYAVINSTSGTGGTAGSIAFQVLGKTGGSTVGSGTNSLGIARKLKGFLNASAPGSVSTDTNNITTITYGYAGTSKVGANYQSGLTKDANNQKLSAATTLTNLAAILQNRGALPQPTASPTATPTATP